VDTLNSPCDAARVLMRLTTEAGDLFSRIVTTAPEGVEVGQMLGAGT
jgi:hypothetical protein